MHQIRFRLCLRPAAGAYIVPPDSVAGFKGPTSKGRKGRKGRRKEKEGRGREGEEKGTLQSLSSPKLIVSRIDTGPCKQRVYI